MHSDEWATSRQLPSAKDDCVAIVSTHECSSSTLFIVNIKCSESKKKYQHLTMKMIRISNEPFCFIKGRFSEGSL